MPIQESMISGFMKKKKNEKRKKKNAYTDNSVKD